MTSASPSREEPSFEEAYQRLEEIVQAMEAGSLTLERAIGLYEEGMRLAQLCTRQLDAAELRITRLQNALEEALGRGPGEGEP